MKISTNKIIEKFYKKNTLAYKILTKHSLLVQKKALKIAKNNKNLNIDIDFIKDAARLHDIGIFMTNAKGLGCYGKNQYIRHGYLGRKILEKEGFKKHALVCERHTGVGITKEEIIKNKLPLPKRNMVPKTLEEKIICLADKFYSKNPENLEKEEKISEIKKELSKFGKNKVKFFEKLLKEFNIEDK